ncbi:MAG: hypothetical protein QF578_07545 [Alphaproteobacteria bacterium]|jgi:hypothetical protein|nr:hypothetical protein [Alphaproteobacteria bacterium]MDP6564664.1 hypothetical protein [Alphaproteobacteria bacterium]MDP6816333.1 hypothetical protein [Alphaproteobacteria bacterium]
MPYELSWEDRGVVFRFWGVASDDDLRQSNLEIYDDPRFESLEHEIADFTEVTRLDFSSDAVRTVARWDSEASKRNPTIRVAIIGEDSLLIGLANMYRIVFDVQDGNWEQEQFAGMDEARSWLARST